MNELSIYREIAIDNFKVVQSLCFFRRAHDLVKNTKFVEHKANVRLAHFKHNTFALIATLRLDHHGGALLINLGLMATGGSQMDLPVKVGDAFCLVGGGRPHSSDDVCALLLPVDRDGSLGLFSGANLARKVALELLLIHVQRDDLANQSECGLHQLVELVTLDASPTEQVRVDKLEIDNFFRFLGILCNFIPQVLFLELALELDLRQAFKEG